METALATMPDLVARFAAILCNDVLNRPSEICSEPRNMVVFGWLTVIFVAVALLALAAATWTDPTRR